MDRNSAEILYLCCAAALCGCVVWFTVSGEDVYAASAAIALASMAGRGFLA